MIKINKKTILTVALSLSISSTSLAAPYTVKKGDTFGRFQEIMECLYKVY